MYRQEEIKPYSGRESKGKQVEQMFDQIAHSYDALNHRLSWDIDKCWRRKAISQLKPYAPAQYSTLQQARETSLYSPQRCLTRRNLSG